MKMKEIEHWLEQTIFIPLHVVGTPHQRTDRLRRYLEDEGVYELKGRYKHRIIVTHDRYSFEEYAINAGIKQLPASGGIKVLCERECQTGDLRRVVVFWED
jgi:hypothetical protein